MFTSSNTLYRYPLLPGEQTRTLWCLVDPNHEPAPVKVPESASIDDLKQAIKEKFSLWNASTSQLVLWKLTGPEPMDDALSQRIKSYGDVATFAEKLSPSKRVSAVFPHPLEGHVHVLVELRTTIGGHNFAASRKHPRSLPSEDEDRELKREKTYDPTDVDEAKKKQDGTICRIKEITPQLTRNTDREWAVNRAIRGADMDGCYYVDPGIQVESKHCLNALLRTQFVLLVGARASGKTTRLLWLKRELEAKDFQVIYISFKHVSRDNVTAFWNTFGYAVQAAASTGPFAVSQNFTPISSLSDFLGFFHVKAWKRKVVLFIDEFSDMYHIDANIRGQYIRAFTEIRNNSEQYAIRGIMAAGTSGVTNMDSTWTAAPFNIADHVTNPHFSIDETRKLFLEFAQDNFITIDNAVIEDVWAKSNGHPGMVCLCGRVISESLPYMLTFPERVLSYKRWKTFSITHLHDRLYGNDMFRPMIDSLLRESATPSVDFLRSHFVGFIDTVYISDIQQKHRAEFLTAEGVLRKSASDTYHMASAFVDGLIRRYVIPKKFPSAPSTPFPVTRNGRHHVLEFLTQSLKFFDKNIIRLAAVQACKQSNVNIGGLRAQRVPRESVYETELLRILTNWLSEFEEKSVHWHIPTSRYCNIVISQPCDPAAPTILLNILATGDVDFVQAHIEKTADYMDSLSSDEAWVVHFTCEDDYLNHPTWQSDEQLENGGINVVHFWHDQGFSTVSMSARWKDYDGIVQKVDNQRVTLSLSTESLFHWYHSLQSTNVK